MSEILKENILKVEQLNTYYGAVHALKNVSFNLVRGEIISLLGSNGAGKTTTLHTLSGLLKSKTGKIIFDGEEIQNFPAHKRVALGIGQSPEGRMVFPNLTVYENLEMGAYLRHDHKKIKIDFEFCYELFPRLKDRYHQLAQTLSGGEQQMLAIARAYMTSPQLLLLDEPSLGIAPILIQSIFKAISLINQQGTTILLVEQNANLALKYANYAYVLKNGEITLQGKSSELLSNPEVQKAYLGH